MSVHNEPDGAARPRPTALLARPAFTLVFLAIGSVAFVLAMDFGGRAGTAPRVVALPTICLLAFALLGDLRWVLQRRRTIDPDRESWALSGARLRANPYLWLGVFAVSYFVIGAIGSLIVLNLSLARIRGRQPWLPTIVVTVLTTMLFYLVVVVVLGEHLYWGALL